MSSSRPYEVADVLLSELRPNPWSPPVTEDQMLAFCQKYDNYILCYAKRHNLHAESSRRMFTTKGPFSRLYELYISSDAFGDEAMPGILDNYCDILGPVLDDKACPPTVQHERVKEQREKFMAMVQRVELSCVASFAKEAQAKTLATQAGT